MTRFIFSEEEPEEQHERDKLLFDRVQEYTTGEAMKTAGKNHEFAWKAAYGHQKYMQESGNDSEDHKMPSLVGGDRPARKNFLGNRA